jgi:hypothetical protein
MNTEELAKHILDRLETQRFADFHAEDFEEYISGDMEYNTGLSHQECKDRITKQIIHLFKLNSLL